ncbi:MAG: hypothetical protein FWC09_10645 [Lachnospiraceae bacterium]|nr:hypothetical protein [Lachnospiraceae bacterium]
MVEIYGGDIHAIRTLDVKLVKTKRSTEHLMYLAEAAKNGKCIDIEDIYHLSVVKCEPD